jgi:Tfp pilus assembly protein PilV
MHTHRRPQNRASERGTSLIESMIAMAIVLVGLLGFASLQIVTSRVNHFNKRMAQASAMATDMAENVMRWSYADSRLSPSGMATINSTTDASLVSKWDLGRATTPAYTVQFSEAAGNLGTDYQGIAADVDGDGSAEFTRYWNVYAANFGGTPAANGKLVQIIVRWKEPGFGYRQVTTVAYKPNPEFIFQ